VAVLEVEPAVQSLGGGLEIEESLAVAVLAGNLLSMGSAVARPAGVAVAFPLEQMAAFQGREHNGSMGALKKVEVGMVMLREGGLVAGEEQTRSAEGGHRHSIAVVEHME
jgi:hypothetical protein